MTAQGSEWVGQTCLATPGNTQPATYFKDTAPHRYSYPYLESTKSDSTQGCIQRHCDHTDLDACKSLRLLRTPRRSPRFCRPADCCLQLSRADAPGNHLAASRLSPLEQQGKKAPPASPVLNGLWHLPERELRKDSGTLLYLNTGNAKKCRPPLTCANQASKQQVMHLQVQTNHVQTYSGTAGRGTKRLAM